MAKCRVVEYLEGSLSDGGAETLVKDYVLFLDKDRFEPIVLVDWIFTDSANYKRLKDSVVRIIPMYKRYSIFYRAINKFFRERYIDHRLRRILKGLRPDVVHVHLSALHHVYNVRKELKGARLFYTCHSTPSSFFDDDEKEEKAARALIECNNLRLIALHDDMRRELNERFSVSNTVVVKNGIDLYRYRHPNLDRDEMRKALSIPENAFVVGNVARFAPEKNHNFLIEVFSLILKKEPKAFLLLVGAGEGKEAVESLISEKGLDSKVMILSSRTDIPEILNTMDVFVFPSLYEGLGIALVEAQAAGLRCVVSNTINAEAFVTDFVVSKSLDEAPEEWASCVLDTSLVCPRDNRLEEYDISRVIKKLERLYLGEV